MIEDQIPPHNIEMEQATLGAMILDKRAIEDVTAVLTAEAFYRDAHRYIYDAIIRVSDAYVAVDPFSVQEELKKAGMLEAVGGAGYLIQLMNSLGAAANAKYYAKSVQDCYIRRKLLATAAKIEHMAHDKFIEMTELTTDAALSLSQALSAGPGAIDVVNPIEGTKKLFDRVEYAVEHRGEISGMSSGFSDFDWNLNGIKNNQLIVIVARPSVGKSSLLLAKAEHIAKTYGTTLVFSLEMSDEELYMRRLSMMSQVDSHRIESGYIEGEEKGRVYDQGGKLEKIPLHIVSKGGLTVNQIYRMAEQWKQKGLKAIVVDYLQLLKPENKSANRVNQVSEIAQGLKEIAMKLEVPVITAAQLNRQIEGSERPPRLSDIRECGEIENSADVVAALFDPDAKAEANKPREIELHMLKVRGGKKGIIKLWWEPHCTRFSTIAKERY